MERKMLFNIHFFLIVVLAAQEAVVQIEARCVISSLSYNKVRVACIDDGDKSLCSMMCQMNSLLTFGTCKNDCKLTSISKLQVVASQKSQPTT
ncbi:hypothetical protein P8452_73486 [Trifolium repens]|nr:hypothetical protein P8452_73486 [Trifolium repens]